MQEFGPFQASDGFLNSLWQFCDNELWKKIIENPAKKQSIG
jgi:hypothetical protein